MRPQRPARQIAARAAWMAIAWIAGGAMAIPARAQEPAPAPPRAAIAPAIASTAETRILSVAPRAIQVDGKRVAYQAEVAETVLRDPHGGVEARIVTPAYLGPGGKDGGRNGSDRPVLFAFNGGPGASSSVLHYSLLGPKVLALPDGVNAPFAPPYRTVDNQQFLIDAADIVLIDPVGTGFSRLNDQAKRGEYYSAQGDGLYIARVIAAWLRAHGRAGAPVHILGESYGAQRAVTVAKYLTDGTVPGAKLRGLMLLSQSISVFETVQRRANVVTFPVALPSLAAIAWYHGRAETRGGDIEYFLRRVRAFAQDEYLPALFAGNALPADRRAAIAARLAAFTGISTDYYLAHDLRITKEQFRRELLAGQGLILGRYDGRYTGPASTGGDPSMAWLSPAIQSASDTIWAGELSAPAGETYRVQDDGDTRWTYLSGPLDIVVPPTYRQLDYPVDLAEAMTRDGGLRVLVAGGYFDTTASIGADEFLMRTNAYPAARITAVHYVGGHMFYTERDSRLRFVAAIRALIGAGNAP